MKSRMSRHTEKQRQNTEYWKYIGTIRKPVKEEEIREREFGNNLAVFADVMWTNHCLDVKIEELPRSRKVGNSKPLPHCPVPLQPRRVGGDQKTTALWLPMHPATLPAPWRHIRRMLFSNKLPTELVEPNIWTKSDWKLDFTNPGFQTKSAV